MSSNDSQPTREQLEKAIAAQESLRGTLDDAIVDTTIAVLRKQLSELDQSQVLEQQRKQVSVMFMDVVNSTHLMQAMDPEENLAIMDAALQKMAEPVQTHGGRVTRFMGDGFLAVFGLPRAQENDPEMAVRAGLEILEVSHTLAGELEKEWQIKEFQVRVGVNTGLVVTGGVTEAEGTVMGTAVNLAARLESSAPPGSLLISQDTYQHVRGIFDVVPGEPIQMKGFSEPVRVYLVKSAKPHTFRVRTRGIEGVDTHMVGRQKELNALQQAFKQVVQEPAMRFVTVIGEAGLGKSRLLDEFERGLNQEIQTGQLLKGRATLETLGIPYGLLRDLLASRWGILDDDPIAVVREKVVAGFREALGEIDHLERNAHFVGYLLGYGFGDSPHLQTVLEAPRQLRDRALVYLAAYFQALAHDHPLVIFLDDIHWADESSLDILIDLSQELSAESVLIIALTRPTLFERRISWAEMPFDQRVDLSPLSIEESRHLVEHVLQKVQDVPAALSELIIGNAEGNPFYIEELIRMLIDDGVVLKGDHAWHIRPERLVEVRIPATLAGVLQARLDSLPSRERIVAQQASVVGRVFWEAAIIYMNIQIPADTQDSHLEPLAVTHNLAGLQRREMIFQQEASVFSDTIEYFFKHTILRDVTYESVLKRMRGAYHAVVSDWLIEHSGERSREVNGLIAGHLEKAGKQAEALIYLQRAAEAAVSNYAIDEAANFYERALALTPENDLIRRYNLLLGSEKVFGMQGDRAAQNKVLDSLETVVEQLEDTPKQVRVLILRAWYAFWISEYPKMIACAQHAAELAETIEDTEFAGKAYYAWAWGYLQQGVPDQALQYAQKALELARQVHDRHGEGNTLNILGMISIAHGNYFLANEHLQGFLTISRSIGDREREMTALNNLGVNQMSMGGYLEAQDYFQQISGIAGEIGDKFSLSTSLINLAWAVVSQQDWNKALKILQQALQMKREYKHTEAVAEGLVWLGHAWMGLGDLDKAVEAYQESLEIRKELSLPHLAMEVIAGLARAALIQGDVESAQAYVEQIMSYLDSGGTLEGTWEMLRIYQTCIRILQQVDDPRAQTILNEAYNLLQQQAAFFPQGNDRQRFLEEIPWHREILSLWQTSHTMDVSIQEGKESDQH